MYFKYIYKHKIKENYSLNIMNFICIISHFKLLALEINFNLKLLSVFNLYSLSEIMFHFDYLKKSSTAYLKMHEVN